MVWHMAKTVLIVDDDPTQRRLMQAAAEKQGFRARVVENGDRALEEASDARHGVDVVLLDLVMPGLSGQDTLQRLIERRPDLPVIVVTATGGIDTVVQAMRAGAVDFFVKPASPERIAISIRNALKLSDLRGEVKRLVKKTEGRMGFEDMIASAPAMRGVVRLGQRAASSSIPILILGESGVGKEVIARCIQGASERAGKPFISVNCGAIPENLVESILFGHEKGSFTGATDKKLGKFVEADGGTLFLDEVGELPLEMQVKLLRVLQEGEVDAVGSRRPTKIDVRIISATNRDLATQVKEGRFREDLYYRLNVFPIEIPSLKERREDLPALVDHFVGRHGEGHGRRAGFVVDDGAGRDMIWGVVLDEVVEGEPFASDHDDVGAAVGHDFELGHLRHATDAPGGQCALGDAGDCGDDAEAPVAVAHVGNQLPVARLEQVQGQAGAGEEHDAQRKDGEQEIGHRGNMRL